ncbi:MAG: response regulator transcription factor [Bacteroidota bacterium]
MENVKKRYKVAIIDDDAELLEQLTVFINRQTDMECLVSAGSLYDFFRQYDAVAPADVVLLDYFLDEEASIESVKSIRNISPLVKIIIITGRGDADLALDAIRVHIDGYYLKGSVSPNLAEIIRQTMTGGAYLAPHAARAVLDGFMEAVQVQVSSKADQIRARLPWNAPNRAIMVIEGLLDGLSYQEIADKIGLSIDGVRYYTRQIYKELGITKRVQLIHWFDKPA